MYFLYVLFFLYVYWCVLLVFFYLATAYKNSVFLYIFNRKNCKAIDKNKHHSIHIQKFGVSKI